MQEIIPARHGIATPLSAGQTIKIINTHGTQVIDTWAFTLSSSKTIETQMSMVRPLSVHLVSTKMAWPLWPNFSSTPALSARLPQTQNSPPHKQHTRASLCRTIPRIGDGLYNNRRERILTVTEDTTPGIHDTLIAACDKQRYEELGGGSEHRNCGDNLVEGLGAIGA